MAADWLGAGACAEIHSGLLLAAAQSEPLVDNAGGNTVIDEPCSEDGTDVICEKPNDVEFEDTQDEDDAACGEEYQVDPSLGIPTEYKEHLGSFDRSDELS